jgi:hypothetical protein
LRRNNFDGDAGDYRRSCPLARKNPLVKALYRHASVRAAPAVVALLAISSVVWLAYFYLASDLGLYQDDVFMYHIVHNARNGIISEAFDISRGYGGEGRVGNGIVMVLFAGLGKHLAGVTGLYIVCWILLCIQAAVAYVFFRHFFSYQTSWLAAAFLILFPADAAKFFAISYMGIVSHTLFIIAAIFAVRGHIVSAVLTIVLIATIGEPYIPMGFLLALVILAFDRSAWRKAAGFLVLYLVVFLAYAAARVTLAPGRGREAFASDNKFELVQRMIESMFYGAGAAFSSLYKRVPEVFAQAGSTTWTIVAIVFGILVLLLLYAKPRFAEPAGAGTGTGTGSGTPALSPRTTGFLVAFGVLMCLAAYPLYGLYPPRFPPVIIDGKFSNIHGTAGFGVATLAAVLFHQFETRAASRYRLLLGGRLLLVAYLALTAGYFALVQKRYVDSWRYQLAFFRHLPEAVPNMHADTLIVVESHGSEGARLEGGSPFDWTLPHLMPFMWRVPPEWQNFPFGLSCHVTS